MVPTPQLQLPMNAQTRTARLVWHCSLFTALAFSGGMPRRAAAQADAAMNGVGHHNRLLLARARVLGKTELIVLVLSAPGACAQVAEQVHQLGGRVQARFDDVGYLRVRVPRTRFGQLRALRGVEEARIDSGFLDYEYDQGTDREALKVTSRAAALGLMGLDTPGAPRPAVPTTAGRARVPNPFVPMMDMRAPQFTRLHPTYDGRGVTIAVVEGGVLDLSHPALQLARTLTGDSVPKIIGILSPSAYDADPEPGGLASVLTRDSTPNPWRVRRTGLIDVREGTFAIEGQTYHAPHTGRLSFGFYHGQPKGSNRTYAVVWDSAGHVWVDTDRDRDFRNEPSVTDYNQTHAIGYLRQDGERGAPSHPIPFAVVFDSGGASLHIYEARAAHQTMVASVAAGHGILGGADASAPSARILVVDAGVSLGDAIEGFIRAARDPRVDLITSSQGGMTFPGTGESIISLVLGRLVERYGKLITVAAGNGGSPLSTAMEPATAPGVLAVGAYVSRESYLAHFDWRMDAPDWLWPRSARGPTADGAMKPDLVAPLFSIAAQPCSEGQPAPYLVYTLPSCYGLAAGTSSAAPHAAGAAALLISAARQASVAYDARRLAWALRAGARPLSGYGVHEQGAGLIDVGKAWELLRSSIDVPAIQTVASVNTRLNQDLRQPGRGRGLFEREGWAAGDTGTRTITLIRTTGPAGALTYDLRWRGNDGTFETPVRTIALVLNQPREVAVHLAPREPGVHSAALAVVDRPSGVAVHEVLATVVAAHQLTATNGYTVRLRGVTAWPRPLRFFVHVPPGVGVLRVEMAVRRGRLTLRTDDPATLEVLAGNSGFKSYRFPLSRTIYITPGRAGVQLFPGPMPGVWEFLVSPVDNPPDGVRDSAQYHVPADVELAVSALGVRPGVPPDSAASAAVPFAFTNEFASLAGTTLRAELGARRATGAAIEASMDGPSYDVQVDSGTTTLRVALETASDSAARLDLYLFDCTKGPCFLWDAEIVHGLRSELLVRAPHPGLWKAVVDPVRVPTGSHTSFRYTQILTNPAYGTASVDPSVVPRGAGAEWAGSATVHRGSARPPNGSELVLVADLIDPVSEAAEQARPLARFGGPPYRPAPLGTAIVPLTIAAAPR